MKRVLILLLVIMALSGCTAEESITTQTSEGEEDSVKLETNTDAQEQGTEAITENEENSRIVQEIKPIGQYGKGRITDISWSPDGTLLAVATTTSIDFVNGEDFVEILSIRPKEPVVDIDFSPDGSGLASLNVTGKVEIWDVSTGEKVEELVGETIHCLEYSNDGGILAMGGEDEVIFWDLVAGESYVELQGDIGSVRGLSFSPTEGILAVGISKGKVLLWNLASHTIDKEVGWYSAGISDVLFSSDGKVLAYGGTNLDTHLWDVESESDIAKIDNCFFGLGNHSFSFSSNGEFFASGSYQGRISIWNSHTGILITTITAHDGNIANIVYSPNESMFVTSGADGALRVWNEQTYTLQHEVLVYPSPVVSISISPDGTRLAAGDGSSVWLWNVDTGGRINQLVGHSERVTNIAFSPDGNCVASGGYDHKILFWDILHEQKIVLVDEVESWVTALSFSPDGTLLASGLEKEIYLWDVKSGEEKFIGASADWVMGILVAEDNSNAITLNRSGIIESWDLSEGKLTTTYNNPENCISQDVVYSGDEFISSGYSEKMLYVWNILTGEIVNTFVMEAADQIPMTRLSSDGVLLAVYYGDDVIQLWDLESGELFAELKGYTTDLRAMLFSYDNARFYALDETNVVLRWEIPSP